MSSSHFLVLVLVLIHPIASYLQLSSTHLQATFPKDWQLHSLLEVIVVSGVSSTFLVIVLHIILLLLLLLGPQLYCACLHSVESCCLLLSEHQPIQEQSSQLHSTCPAHGLLAYVDIISPTDKYKPGADKMCRAIETSACPVQFPPISRFHSAL